MKVPEFNQNIIQLKKLFLPKASSVKLSEKVTDLEYLINLNVSIKFTLKPSFSGHHLCPVVLGMCKEMGSAGKNPELVTSPREFLQNFGYL